MIHIIALQNLVPNCIFTWKEDTWEGLEWLDERTCPSKEEWEAEKARLIAQQPLEQCKQKAQILLNESDWTDLYTVRQKLENINEWDIYRELIRHLRIYPTEHPIFPDKPQTIWKEIIPISIEEPIVAQEPIQEEIVNPIDEPIINNEETII